MRNKPNWADGAGPRSVKCAKRTQFRPSRPSTALHYSSVPLFHHSNPLPIVRNKANWPSGRRRAGRPTHEEPRGNRAKRSQSARPGRVGRGLGAWDVGQMRKTNPISEGVLSVKCQVLSRASRASSPRSLPTSNFTLGSPNAEFRVWGPLQTSGGTPTAQSETCKTNPIPGRARWDEGRSVQNEPNSSIAAWGLGIQDSLPAGRPLRGAGPGAGCTNKPNWPERIVQNEPNSRRGRVGRGQRGVGRGGKCAKRSQFRKKFQG